MDTSNTNGEATPSQNTAQSQAINPLTFDEAALAKILKQRFSEPQESEQQAPATEDTASAEDPEQQASDAQDDANQPGDQDETPESDPSNEDQADQLDSEPKGVQKRIDKLTRARKEAVERAETLERELNDAKAKLEELAAKPQAAPVADANNPFADIWDDAKLTDEWTKARELRRWCEDNQDGCELNGKEYSADDIKAIRRRVEDAIDVHIPKRSAFLQQHRQIKPVAETIYPWWKDRSAVEYTEAQSVLRAMPQLSQIPEYQVLVGDFIEGRKLRLAREADKGKAKTAKMPARPAPRQPSVATASPVRVEKSQQDLLAARAKFLKTGNQAELAQLLKRGL